MKHIKSNHWNILIKHFSTEKSIKSKVFEKISKEILKTQVNLPKKLNKIAKKLNKSSQKLKLPEDSTTY